MKKKLASIICAILCLTTMATCLAGCGKDDTANGDIPVISCVIPGDEPEDLAEVLAEANKTIEKEVGARLDLRFIDDSAYGQRMELMMSSGEEIDLCFIGYLYSLQKSYRKGGLMDITDYLKNSTPDLYNSIDEEVWKSVTFNDGIYAVPNIQVMCMGTNIGFRKDMVEKYGLDISSVKTWEDVIPFMEKIRDNEPSLIPIRKDIVFDNVFGEKVKTDTWSSEMIFLNQDTMKVEPVMFTEQGLKDAKLAHEFYKKGFIRKDIATVTDDTADYANGRYVILASSSKPGDDADLYKQTGHEYVTVMMQPYGMSYTAPRATTLAVPRVAKKPELSVKMIEFLHTNKDVFNMLVYGLEGKHYNKVGDNRVEIIPNSGYDIDAQGWKFGNQFNQYLRPDQKDDVWEETERLNAESPRSPLMGFVYDDSEITTEIAQCQKVFKQYSTIAKGGTEDPENYWAEYQSMMKKAGVDTIVNEIQRQIDEFLAK